MGVIPKKFVLEPGLKRKDILRKDYHNMTVADLRAFMAELQAGHRPETSWPFFPNVPGGALSGYQTCRSMRRAT